MALILKTFYCIILYNNGFFRIPIIDATISTFVDKGQKKNSSEIWFDPSIDMDTSLYCNMLEKLIEFGCLQNNILEIWKFSDRRLQNITKDDILHRLNITTVSPITGHPTNFERLLGGVKRNANGYIISARTIISFWMANLNFSAIDMSKVGNDIGTADWVCQCY